MSKAEREGGEVLVDYATYKNINKYSTAGNIYYFVVVFSVVTSSVVTSAVASVVTVSV